MKAASLVLVLTGLAVTLRGAEGQANMANSLRFWNETKDEQLMAFADFMASNEAVTEQLFDIARSLTWLVQSTNGDPLGDSIMPMVLSKLPGVFSSNYLKLAVGIAVNELHRAAPNATMQHRISQSVAQEFAKATQLAPGSAAFNATLTSKIKEKITQYTFAHLNKLRAVNRYLANLSARDLLFELNDTTPTVNRQCYSDTMDFFDGVVGGRLVMTSNSSGGPPSAPTGGNIVMQHVASALKMLDSWGKPSGGILKGAVHYVGSFDECGEVHVTIPRNDSILFGQHPHDHNTDFGTRFCRITFDLPKSITEGFGVDTHGIELALHWGTCFPDTCHSDDIAAMFHLGKLHSYNISVHSVFCSEEQSLEEDAGGIFAVVFLSLLVGVVLFCTLLEAYVTFYNNNFAPAPTPSHSSVEDDAAYVNVQKEVVYDNAAFEPDAKDLPGPSKEKEASLPGSYMHHREAPPVFKDGLPPARLPAPTPAPAPVPAPSSSSSKSYSLGNGHEQRKSSPPPSYHSNPQSARQGSEKRVPRLVKVFSVLTNMPKLLSGQKSPKAIHCLHGIRFFSLMWVVLGHTYNYGVISVVENPTTENLIDAEAFFHRFTFQGVMAAGFAVDTFFLLSGLLVTWLTLKDLDKKKNGVGYWVMFYVHRFWRLTPLYMIVMMTFTCLHTYLGGGPLWPQELNAASYCKENWWTNLLYVNNLVNKDKMCMGWTWYLANDMQFYWISPGILLAMFYLAPLGIGLASFLLAGGIAAAMHYQYINGGDIFTMHEDKNQYWDQVYIVPWCRVAAYAIGMLLGYVFYTFKQRTLKMSTAVIGWVLTWGCGLFLCYITFTKREPGAEKWTKWEDAIYESVGRPLWAACVGWIIFACHNNRGGFINSILGWEGFLPLSRLTYAAYLVHPIVMMMHAYTKKSLYYVDDFEMLYLFLGHSVITFFTAFFFSLVAEAPALALEKLVFRLH